MTMRYTLIGRRIESKHAVENGGGFVEALEVLEEEAVSVKHPWFHFRESGIQWPCRSCVCFLLKKS